MKNLVRERTIRICTGIDGELKQMSLKEVADAFFSNKVLFKENGKYLFFIDIIKNIGVFKKDAEDEDIKKRAIYLALLVKNNHPSDNMIHAIGMYTTIKVGGDDVNL